MFSQMDHEFNEPKKEKEREKKDKKRPRHTRSVASTHITSKGYLYSLGGEGKNSGLVWALTRGKECKEKKTWFSRGAVLKNYIPRYALAEWAGMAFSPYHYW